MHVAVLTPRRADYGRRDQLAEWTAARWADLHPDFEVVEGHHDDGPFNRAAAINDAAAKAPDADVYVVADCDSFVDAAQLRQAIDTAVISGQVTFAYDRFAYLSRAMSDAIMDGFAGDWWPGVEWTMTGTCSSMVVASGPLWRTLGGADEGFIGWGGEDIALSLALQTFGGGMKRIPGEVWHLWHPPAPHTNDDVWPDRMELYADAAYNAEAMRELVDRLRAEVHA